MGQGRWIPAVWVVYALAGVVVLQAAAYVWYDTHALFAQLADASILFIFALTIAVIGYRLHRRGTPRDDIYRVAFFSLAGGLIVGLLALLFLVIRVTTHEPFPDQELVLFIGWSVGSAAGAWSGYYYVGLEASLADQRDLTKRLTVLQRVLRHNLRNEMSVIGGTTRNLSAAVEDAGVAKDLERINRHVENVIELSDRSQTLTRIWQSDAETLFDLADLVDDEVERFQEAHPTVEVSTDVPSGLRVRGHAQFPLAIREALANAVEHNAAVTVSVTGTSRNGSHAVVVSDTGSGIPDSELEPLWAPAEGPMVHTTGLGLWMIYWLVESSGGTLEFETGSAGTTIEMWLPAA
jgi:signal transduction histidine kinase